MCDPYRNHPRTVTGWEGGSTRRWRKIRKRVLDDNQEATGGRCTLHIPNICTTWATQVHHTRGRAVTGDDPRYLVASCGPCNQHIGEPGQHDPQPAPRTQW